MKFGITTTTTKKKHLRTDEKKKLSYSDFSWTPFHSCPKRGCLKLVMLLNKSPVSNVILKEVSKINQLPNIVCTETRGMASL